MTSINMNDFLKCLKIWDAHWSIVIKLMIQFILIIEIISFILRAIQISEHISFLPSLFSFFVTTMFQPINKWTFFRFTVYIKRKVFFLVDLGPGPVRFIMPTLHLVGWWPAQTNRVRALVRARPSPPLISTLSWLSGHWPCVKSCLVGGSDKYLISLLLQLANVKHK